jgi:uncharacterized protein (TIGR01777 family)
MAKILISGGSGLVGKNLTAELCKKGHDVIWLSRRIIADAPVPVIPMQTPLSTDDLERLKDVSVVIQLAGAGIVAKAWTVAYKRELRESRVQSSEWLGNCLRIAGVTPRVWIGASAIGYYGSTISDDVCDETAASGDDFMARLCQDWEQAQLNHAVRVERMVLFRIGIVLSSHGGAYPKMALPVKLGVGAVLGNGAQYFSWIHEHDLLRLFLVAMEDNSWKGIYNAVSPGVVTNRTFTQELAKSMGRRIWLPPIPSGLLKLVLGERYLTVCRGLKISSAKIHGAGFTFRYPRVTEALMSLQDSAAR